MPLDYIITEGDKQMFEEFRNTSPRSASTLTLGMRTEPRSGSNEYTVCVSLRITNTDETAPNYQLPCSGKVDRRIMKKDELDTCMKEIIAKFERAVSEYFADKPKPAKTELINTDDIENARVTITYSLNNNKAFVPAPVNPKPAKYTATGVNTRTPSKPKQGALFATYRDAQTI